MLSEEAKKKDWTMFQEPHISDDNDELYERDIIFVKENQAFVVAVTVRHEYPDTSLEQAMMEKVKKYQHLHEFIQELINVVAIVFMGFAPGTWIKKYQRNYELLRALSLSRSRQEKTAWASRRLLACRYVCK